MGPSLELPLLINYGTYVQESVLNCTCYPVFSFMFYGNVHATDRQTYRQVGYSTCFSFSGKATYGNMNSLYCSSRRAVTLQAGPPERQTAAPPLAQPDLQRDTRENKTSLFKRGRPI